MTCKLQSPRLARPLAGCAAAVALAAPSAAARPVEQFIDPPSPCETQWIADYQLLDLGSQAPRSCEEQVAASRGSGAPAPAKPTAADTFPGLAATARGVPRVESADAGFDWASAAIGAATAAGLVGFASLAARATSRRSRLRTAR
jgi:hypothetical protein